MAENMSRWQESHRWEPSPFAHPEPVPLVSSADLVNPLLTAGEVTTPNPRTCSPFSTVLEAVLLFRDADCGVVPVVDEGRPVGVVTDRDVALALAERLSELPDTPVAELMSRDLVTVPPETTLGSAVETLGREGVRRVLVVDPDGRLQGVLSWTDLVPHVSERGLGHLVGRLVEKR